MPTDTRVALFASWGNCAEAAQRNIHSPASVPVSQINGCSFCVDSGAKHARKSGESDERLFAVAAWRDTPYNVFNRPNVPTRMVAGSVKWD